MHKYLIPLIILGVTIGFRGEEPTTTSYFAGKSECFTVSGEINQAGNAHGVVFGTVSGDIEGAIVSYPSSPVGHGASVYKLVEQTWEVSGGIIDPLIGHTLQFENDFLGVMTNFPMMVANYKMRIVDGALKGNLTAHGWTLITDYPNFINYMEYHGVICP
jgi:hypothetical protein